jgi:hypothetical protein
MCTSDAARSKHHLAIGYSGGYYQTLLLLLLFCIFEPAGATAGLKRLILMGPVLKTSLLVRRDSCVALPPKASSRVLATQRLQYRKPP